MHVWEVVHHRAAVAGKVTDDSTGKAIARARVAITVGPPAFEDWLALYAKQYGDDWQRMEERPDRTVTMPDGHFHFLDLPAGPYTFQASLPDSGTRYGTVEAALELLADSLGNVVMKAVDLAVPSTAIEGRITAQASIPDTAVFMAEVRVKGSGERAFSDAEGRYRLTALEVGRRILSVSARGFQPLSQAVQLSHAGEKKPVDFLLTPS